MAGGRDHCVGEDQPIVTRHRRGLICHSGPVERSEEPITAPVSREHSARAVGSVSGGGKPNNEPGGLGIAKDGHGAAPIFRVRKALPLHPRHLLAPFHQAWAFATADNLLIQCVEGVHNSNVPIYEYEPDDRDCLMCEGKVAVIQTITEPTLEFCPWCGLNVKRVVSRVSFKMRGIDPVKDGGNKGFTTFKKSEKGVWEKVTGEGPDFLVGSKEDMAAVEAEKLPKPKILDLD